MLPYSSWGIRHGLQQDRPRVLPNERRGWLSALLSAAPVIADTAGSLSGGNAKDQERFATALSWYNRAVVNDVDALNCLKYMSGRFGSGPCGGSTASGFATQVAKDYSFKLYNQAVQVLQGQLPSSVPVPTTPAATTPAPVTVTATTGPAGSGVTVQAGSNPPPTQQQQQSNTLIYVLLAVVAVGGFAVWYTRRGR